MTGIILLGQAAETAPTSASGEAVSRLAQIQAFVEATLLPAITHLEGRLVIATLLAGVGLWLMLPGNGRRMKVIGALLALLGAGAAVSVLPVIGWQFESVVFWMLAGVTVSSAVATITSRSPVYCAVWFAVVLLGTGGLFMINGAQFLGVATVAVYAGAIVVTFLFVLMLAQPEGHSFYDPGSFPRIYYREIPVPCSVTDYLFVCPNA